MSQAELDFDGGAVVSTVSSAIALLIKNSVNSLNLKISLPFACEDSQCSMVFLSNALIPEWTRM